MKMADRRGELREQTAEALDRYAEVRAEVDGHLGEEPRPGDLYLLRQTAEAPVEWAVIARDLEDPHLLLAVPADTHPQIGSGDVEVPESASCGPSALRCRYGVRLRAADFASATVSGRLDPYHVLEAQARRADLESGRLDASDSELEVDADPDYQDWEEVLREARAALNERHHEDAPASDKVVELQPPARLAPPRLGAFSHPFSLAASVLLLVSLAFAAGFAWRGEPPLAPPLNPPIVWLTPIEKVRGQPTELLVPTGSAVVSLVLETRTPKQFSDFRLEILDDENKDVVWSHDRLRMSGTLELNVLVPSRLLPPGEYRLRLDGLDRGSQERLAEYLLAIEVE